MKKSLWLKMIFGVLLVVPTLVVYGFWHRIYRYHLLLNEHECQRNVCEADFDGDGVQGSLSVDKNMPAEDFDSWLVVTDSGKELLREPRRSIDNTLRTHAGIVSSPGGARLIIYDHIFDHKPPRSSVFAYDGRRMARVTPSEGDLEILAAMAARDETGTFEAWMLFQILSLPALACYYLLLAFAGWKLFSKRKHRRAGSNR